MKLMYAVQGPKRKGRHTGGPAKEAGEIGGVFIAQLIGDLLDIEFCVIEQTLGFQEDLLLYPITEGESCDALDRLIEI